MEVFQGLLQELEIDTDSRGMRKQENNHYKSHPSQFRDERNNNWTRQGYSHNTNREQNRHHPYDNHWQSNSYRERSHFRSNEYDGDNHRNRQFGNQNYYYHGRQNNFRRNGPPCSDNSGRNSPPLNQQERNCSIYRHDDRRYNDSDRPEFYQNWRDSNRAGDFRKHEFVEARSPNPSNDAHQLRNRQ
ncbi:GATA zinc finger domain-containing protein 14-like [Schistocerca cancellata]|uniref:GATA zinc finger domain-containing protein 14-like n=1 Tax=Schistocerca cancellata TaxID=274614 RepID=UPI002117D381|nr:GATA zinc finger domain-containing protein 14-like [Schistocerca cancellata]